MKSLILVAALVLSSPFSTFGNRERAASPSAIDVPMLTSDPMPVIEAMINGKGPFRFAIDTGSAAKVVLSGPLVEQLALKPAGQTPVGDPSGKNMLTVDTFHLESVAIGDIRFPSVGAIKLDLPRSPSGQAPPKIDGILGFPLFSDYLFTIDYLAGRVRLEPGTLPEPDGAEILSFEKPHRIPVVEIDIAGVKIKAHIDSGNTRGYIGLHSSMIDKVPLSSTPTTVGKARTVNNEFEIKAALLKGSARIGQHEFPQPTISFSDVSRGNGNLGASLLRQFALTFDQKNDRVRFARKASSTPALPAGATVVELPMLFRGPMPAVEVKVNGQGPFLFAIDTGASGMGRVDSSLVEKLKLPEVGEVRGSDGSGANARGMKLIQVDLLTIGNLEFRNLRAASRNYNLSPNLPHIDGILGFNLFSDYLLTLDYAAKRVRLEKGQLPEPNGAEVLSYESQNGIPKIDLQVGDAKIKAHIDSGNTVGAFMLPAALAEKLSFLSPPVTVGKARTVSSEIEIKEARVKGSIRLGRFEFPEPTIHYPAVSQDANIGSKALQDFALTFDQKHLRVKLSRQEQPKTSLPGTSGNSHLQQYAGRYGQRMIFFEDGALFIQRDGGPKLKLIPASDGEFTLQEAPLARIKFVKKDDALELQVLNPQGQWEAAKKEGGK
jgi:predicted aspartyl protease